MRMKGLRENSAERSAFGEDGAAELSALDKDAGAKTSRQTP